MSGSGRRWSHVRTSFYGLPWPDLEQSIRVLHTRNGGPPPGEFDLNSHVILHRSNYDLAKIVVYTEGKTPEETRDSVLTAVAEKA